MELTDLAERRKLDGDPKEIVVYDMTCDRNWCGGRYGYVDRIRRGCAMCTKPTEKESDKRGGWLV
jgi:hypothetical protein